KGEHMIVDQDLLKLVKTNEMFKAVPESFLKSFIKPKNFVFVKEGSLIYSFDDESNDFYLIVEGEVKMKFCDQNNIERRYLLDFFGEKEILDGSNRASFVIAEKDCTLYKIDAETFKDLMVTNETIADNINKVGKLESAEVAEEASIS
ncbi:MAG: cyclic nucleotide-binding domain-containing protein, partial [Ignavibacteriaceae bacterium]